MTSLQRGRVLRAVDAATVRPRPKQASIIVLMLVLPMFAGLFAYVVDAPALYGLSKIWPLLTAPLALLAMWRLRLPYQPLVLTICAWMLGVTPVLGVLQLGNDVVGAVAAGVKIWPLTGALGLAAALWLTRPNEADLARVVTVLSGATFAFLIGAWLFAPEALFGGGIEDTKVFLTDPERGRRINAPMMFGILGLLLVSRGFWRRPSLWRFLLIALGLLAMVLFYKQRAQIVGTIAVLGLAGALSLHRWRAPVLLAAAAVTVGGALPLFVWLSQDAAAAFGGSLSMRQIEAEAALRFLNDAPWRWIVGVGSATRIGGVTLGDIVGTPFFYPSDLGWLGVVFEYGLIGAGLMLAAHLAAIRLAWAGAQVGGDLSRAVFDYAVFLLIVSPVISVVLSPGELAVVLALSWWLRTLRGRPGDGSASAS